MERHADVDIVYGSTRYFYDGCFEKKYVLDSNGMIPTIEMDRNDQDQPWILVFRNLTTICATMYRRSVFTTVNTFKNIIFEDWYFHLECALKGKIFHFERMMGSTCFVRLSGESQMYKHKKVEAKSPGIFPAAIDQLIKEYDYKTPFERPVSVEAKTTWKDGVRLFLPPIFIKAFRIVKGKK